MFYSQDILQKRGGKFGKIWLAATKMSKLTRREIASVNIDKSCEDILQYIELRLDPQLPRKHRPRLSLYLSALLMYGVVRIHYKHSQYLLDDVEGIFVRVSHVVNKLTEIELREQPRADSVTLPEVYGMMTFEDITSQELDDMLTVPEHHEDVWWLQASLLSPKSEQILSPKPTRKRKTRKETTGEEEDGQRTGPPVASVEDITMREAPILPSMDMDNIMSPHRQIPPEQDLPPMTLAGLEELLLGFQGEEPILRDEEPMVPGALPDLPTSTPAHPGLHPPTQQTGPSPIPMREELEASLAVQPEERPMPGPGKKPAQPPTPEVTMTTSPQQQPRLPRPSLEMDLSVIAPGKGPHPRKRRRQLTFADGETQIPKEKMKDFLNTGATTCETFTIRDAKGMEAHELLMRPGDRALQQPPWLALWQRRARFRRGIPESELAQAKTPPREGALDQPMGPEEPMFVAYPIPQEPSLGAELELPREMEEMPSVRQDDSVRQVLFTDAQTPATDEKRKGRKRSSTLEQSIEDLRRTAAQSESGVMIDDVSMEAAREKSRGEDSLNESTGPRTTKKRKTRSVSTNTSLEVPQESATSAPTASFHTSGSSRALFDIAEETRFPDFVAVPIREALVEQMNEQSLLDTISECIAAGEEGFTLFSTVCPPETSDRKSAAQNFMVLLGLCGVGQVEASQEEGVDFGEIMIRMED